jgi:hypothetical protein
MAVQLRLATGPITLGEREEREGGLHRGRGWPEGGAHR